MSEAQILVAIGRLLKQVQIDRDRHYIKPLYQVRTHENKIQHLVGYAWSAPRTTYYGDVFDCILGAGDTPELALEEAIRKVRPYTQEPI